MFFLSVNLLANAFQGSNPCPTTNQKTPILLGFLLFQGFAIDFSAPCFVLLFPAFSYEFYASRVFTMQRVPRSRSFRRLPRSPFQSK